VLNLRAAGTTIAPAMDLLVQGGTGGSRVVRKELRRIGCRAEIDVCEMDNYPFSLQWPKPTSMNFTIRKEFLDYIKPAPPDLNQSPVRVSRRACPGGPRGRRRARRPRAAARRARETARR